MKPMTFIGQYHWITFEDKEFDWTELLFPTLAIKLGHGRVLGFNGFDGEAVVFQTDLQVKGTRRQTLPCA